jgi:hypothetical protein
LAFKAKFLHFLRPGFKNYLPNVIFVSIIKKLRIGKLSWLFSLILFLLWQGLWLKKFLHLYNLVPDDIYFHLAQSYRFYYSWWVEHNIGLFFAYPYEYPPLVYAVSALFYKCLDVSLQSAYLSLWPYAVLLFFSLWALGKQLKNPGYGCLLTLLAVASPMLFSEAHKYLLDFPLLSLVALNLYLWQKNPGFKDKKLAWLQGLCFWAGMMTKFSFWYFMISLVIISGVKIFARLTPLSRLIFSVVPLTQLALILVFLTQPQGEASLSFTVVILLALFNLGWYGFTRVKWRNLPPEILNFSEAYLLASLPTLIWYLNFSPALINKIHLHAEPELLARFVPVLIFNLKSLSAVFPFIWVFLSLGLLLIIISPEYRKLYLPYLATFMVSLVLSSLTQGLYWERFMLPLLPVVLVLATYWWQGLNQPAKITVWFWNIVGIAWLWGILLIWSALNIFPGLCSFIPAAETANKQQIAMHFAQPESIARKMLNKIYLNLPAGSKNFMVLGILPKATLNGFDPHLLEFISALENLKPFLYLIPLDPEQDRYSKDLNFILTLTAPLTPREKAVLKQASLLEQEEIRGLDGVKTIYLYKL